MGKVWDLLTHPTELRAVIQYSMWHEPLHARDPSTESEEMRRCYHFLKQTSRSFAMVIQELQPELRTPVKTPLPWHFQVLRFPTLPTSFLVVGTEFR